MRSWPFMIGMSVWCAWLPAQAALSPCGSSVTVRPGDTISAIAERCEVSESALLEANPSVAGSEDLRVGASLSTPPGSGSTSVGGAFSSLGSSAVGAVDALAGKVGSSAQDLLNRNPDLKNRLENLGKQIGIDGAQERPSVVVMPQSGVSGSTVTIAATGLPKEQTVQIGSGLPGHAFDVVKRAQTSVNGALVVDVTIPSSAPPGSIVFVVLSAEGDVLGRSGRFQLVP